MNRRRVDILFNKNDSENQINALALYTFTYDEKMYKCRLQYVIT